MNIPNLHDWDLRPKEAVALQNELAPQLTDDCPIDLSAVETVAGVDVSVRNKQSQAAIVVMSFPRLQIIEIVRAQQATGFPYIPGLLAFREGPVVLQALRQLKSEPNVFIFDGMGRIHPRKMGIAAHLGLWIQRPTLGCGKTHFIGEFDEPAAEKGSQSQLMYLGEQIGVVLRTRSNIKPIYVSVGHLAEINSAVDLVMACVTRFRLPQPIREAHNAAKLSGNPTRNS